MRFKLGERERVEDRDNRHNSIMHIIRMHILYANNMRIAFCATMRSRDFAFRADWFIEVRARALLWPADSPLVITMDLDQCAGAPLRFFVRSPHNSCALAMAIR